MAEWRARRECSHAVNSFILYTKRANASPFAEVGGFLGGVMMGRARMVVVVTGGVVVVSVVVMMLVGCVPVVIESNEAERTTQVESGAFKLCFVV